MHEEPTSTNDLYDLKGCITGGSSHVNLTLDEQCNHHRPLRRITHEREPTHKCFVGQGINRDQTGYLSLCGF